MTGGTTCLSEDKKICTFQISLTSVSPNKFYPVIHLKAFFLTVATLQPNKCNKMFHYPMVFNNTHLAKATGLCNKLVWNA
jgi:hypothetical protein